jgi:hypothetical protein
VAHLVVDRIVVGLRWTAAGLFVIGALLVVGALAFTDTVEALMTSTIVAALAFGVPATALVVFAFWMDREATGAEDVAPVPALAFADVRHPFREPVRRYLVAVAAVLAAWGLRTALEGVLGSGNLPVITFSLAVGIAGWLGGFGPAVLASCASLLLAWYFFVPPVASFALERKGDAIGLGLFLFFLLAIGAITAALHRALLRIALLNEQLRAMRTAAAGTSRPTGSRLPLEHASADEQPREPAGEATRSQRSPDAAP